MNSVGGHPAKAAYRNLAKKGLHSQHFKSFRIPFMPREKAAYLILRRKGLSYNAIAECFGRSTSVVYRVIQRATGFKAKFDVWRRKADLRKLPQRVRLRLAHRARFVMLKLRDAWTQWVSSEEGEPP